MKHPFDVVGEKPEWEFTSRKGWTKTYEDGSKALILSKFTDEGTMFHWYYANRGQKPHVTSVRDTFDAAKAACDQTHIEECYEPV